MRLYQYMTLVAAVVGMFLISACGATKRLPLATIDLEYVRPAEVRQYQGTTYGLAFNIVSELGGQSPVEYVNVNPEKIWVPESYGVNPSVESFASMATGRWIADAGFRSDASDVASRTLTIILKEFHIVNDFAAIYMGPYPECYAKVMLEYQLTDADGNVLMRRTPAQGRVPVDNRILKMNEGSYYHAFCQKMKIVIGGPAASYMLAEAYNRALAEINWSAIADLLTVHDTAVAEPNRRVQGAGDTALENTIIRWYIVSSPQGADVSWRVVSSTPDVHNTNSTYLGTTPYETTESFDIRGLTLENSGNVQIEVTCEKPGYLPQRKRFNLRQAIDQREISAKFNLVAE